MPETSIGPEIGSPNLDPKNVREVGAAAVLRTLVGDDGDFKALLYALNEEPELGGDIDEALLDALNGEPELGGDIDEALLDALNGEPELGGDDPGGDNGKARKGLGIDNPDGGDISRLAGATDRGRVI